jgi:hypothetical protein
MENNNNVELSGKIAKFPKNTKAVKALQFLESVKINPAKLWYIIIEDQGTDLKMIKYNRSKGVNLLDYTVQLKEHYKSLYVNESVIIDLLDGMVVEGETDFSVIKNIPLLLLENGQTLISKMASDLIKLLAD